MRPQNRFLLILFALLLPGTAAAMASAGDEPPQEKTKPRPSPTQPAKGAPPQKSGEEENPYVRRFKELDANKDGYISLAEWPLAEAKFHIVDRNQDGRLSRTELLTPNVLRRDPFEERFRELDRNGDGRLSGSELERGDPGLERQDRDRDGYVTPLEYRSGFLDLWRPSATLQDQRRFRNLDRNLDNRLSQLEFLGSRAVFDRLDRNRDGVLSPSEWP